MKSTPLELSNSVSYNSHTQFMSEVILMTSFSKNTSVTNILKCANAWKLKKRYFLSTYNGLLTDTYCWGRIWILLLSKVFHAYTSLFAANMFLLCNTCRFITPNTIPYKKSVERIIARGWNGIFGEIFF